MGDQGWVAGVAGAPIAAIDSPTELVATTVKVKLVPLVRPVMVHVVAGAVAVQEAPKGDAVAVYEVMAEPPFDAGAVQEIRT